jgi:O-antigen/teichoic acid export membrane protein
VNYAIITAIAPKLSELLSGGEHQRARDVYQVATCWLMTLAWPLYFTLAIFAPLLLKVFKPEYAAGASSLEVLAIAMLVATAIGPVDIVLLMGGRSMWNLFNVVVALVLNLALSFILVPRIGIAGAACAWAASILFNNLAPLAEIRAFLKLHPFGRGFPVVSTSAAICFGAFGLAIRMSVGLSIPSFAAFLIVASVSYAALMWRFRSRAELELLAGTLRARRGRRARPVTA